MGRDLNRELTLPCRPRYLRLSESISSEREEVFKSWVNSLVISTISLNFVPINFNHNKNPLFFDSKGDEIFEGFVQVSS